MSLLREIQGDVAGSGSDTASVLRKCKILAARLGSREFASWVASELDGYADSQSIPDYRRLSITHYASFFGMGWEVSKQAIPLQVVPAEHHARFTFVEFREGIAKAESLADSKHGVTIARPELAFVIQGKMYPQLQCQHVWGEISPIEFHQILSCPKSYPGFLARRRGRKSGCRRGAAKWPASTARKTTASWADSTTALP